MVYPQVLAANHLRFHHTAQCSPSAETLHFSFFPYTRAPTHNLHQSLTVLLFTGSEMTNGNRKGLGPVHREC